MTSEQTAPGAEGVEDPKPEAEESPEEVSAAETSREEEQRLLEEQISATLSNIQLSRGVDEIVELEEDFTEEDVEHLEDVLEGCDNEYKNLFATLDQLGSCLDEVENRNDTLNTRVDDLLKTMEDSQRDRERSLKNWTLEANKVMDDLNRLQNEKE